MNKKIRIVLLGGTGFVGTALLKKISASYNENVEIRALVRGNSDELNCPFLKVFKGELPDNIPDDIFFDKPHVVVHFATKKIDFDSSGFDEINIRGTENLLKKINEYTKGILYGSSMSVYGQGEQVGILEDEKIIPDTELAKSRARAEEIILHEMSSKNKSSLSLRSRVIVGKEDKFTIPIYEKTIKRNIIPGDGNQSFSLISVDDYAEIIIKLSELLLNNEDNINLALNVGYKKPVSFNEIIEALCDIMKLKKPDRYIKLNKLTIWFLNKIPIKKIQNMVTQIELGSYSHWGNVSRLESLIGDSIINKDPVDVLRKVLLEYRG